MAVLFTASGGGSLQSSVSLLLKLVTAEHLFELSRNLTLNGSLYAYHGIVLSLLIS
jgi:hypothetical protein